VVARVLEKAGGGVLVLGPAWLPILSAFAVLLVTELAHRRPTAARISLSVGVSVALSGILMASLIASCAWFALRRRVEQRLLFLASSAFSGSCAVLRAMVALEDRRAFDMAACLAQGNEAAAPPPAALIRALVTPEVMLGPGLFFRPSRNSVAAAGTSACMLAFLGPLLAAFREMYIPVLPVLIVVLSHFWVLYRYFVNGFREGSEEKVVLVLGWVWCLASVVLGIMAAMAASMRQILRDHTTIFSASLLVMTVPLLAAGLLHIQIVQWRRMFRPIEDADLGEIELGGIDDHSPQDQGRLQ
jgi:hypothetical protein